MQDATPRPWEVHEHNHVNGEYWASIGYSGSGPICDIMGEQGYKPLQEIGRFKFLTTPVEQQKANAKLIVTAVNQHDALVAVAEAAREHLRQGTLDTRDTLRAALAALEKAGA